MDSFITHGPTLLAKMITYWTLAALKEYIVASAKQSVKEFVHAHEFYTPEEKGNSREHFTD